MSSDAVSVALALGSNQGDREAHLAEAVAGLARHLRALRVSSVYASDPVGYEDQPAFLNAAVAGLTTLSAEELLAAGHALEDAAGRRRPFRDAPRTLDVDLILYGDRVSTRSDPEHGAPPALRIPHPRWKKRAFVVAPLAEIVPEWRDPETGRTVLDLWTEARDRLPPARRVAPPSSLRRNEP